jgi:hypothetical protein
MRQPSSASSKGDVGGGEVAEVAVGVVPGGEAGQAAAGAARHFDVHARRVFETRRVLSLAKRGQRHAGCEE